MDAVSAGALVGARLLKRASFEASPDRPKEEEKEGGDEEAGTAAAP